MKQLQIEIYGDQKFIATADLKIPAYYAKAEIEGYGNDLLKQSISAMGVKQPIVINTYPGREGTIINGVEVYKISKALGIYELPFYDLYVPLELEKEFHYLFSIKCREHRIEDIIEQLRKSDYLSYFKQISNSTTLPTSIIDKGNSEFKKDSENAQHRKMSFLLRYDTSFEGYLEKLQKLLNAKSQNEALLTLIIDAVEGRINIC